MLPCLYVTIIYNTINDIVALFVLPFDKLLLFFVTPLDQGLLHFNRKIIKIIAQEKNLVATSNDKKVHYQPIRDKGNAWTSKKYKITKCILLYRKIT